MLDDYDMSVFGYPRKQYLESLVDQRTYTCLGVMRDNKLVGYGVLRPSDHGYLVGPLFADDKETAEELLSGLQSYIPDQEVYMDIFECNDDVKEIMDKHGWTHYSTYSRMYARGIPKSDMSRIYSPVAEIS
jgi:hypothetical protein